MHAILCVTLAVYHVVDALAHPVARPCPFFSRGTCLFSDSCNFIHTVKSPVAPEIRITESRDSVLSVYGYPTATTPPNVTSPTLSDRQSPPHADVEVIAPKPRVWEQARRLSWTSIHSISSADSNLTYPTDLSPTASRVSTPPIGEDISLHQHDIHDSYDPSDLVSPTMPMLKEPAQVRCPQRYSRESQLTITNIDRAQRLLQLATESDEDPSPGSGRVALPLPSQPTPLTGSSEATTDASDPSAQVVAFKPTNGSTNSLGEPFRLVCFISCSFFSFIPNVARALSAESYSTSPNTIVERLKSCDTCHSR